MKTKYRVYPYKRDNGRLMYGIEDRHACLLYEPDFPTKKLAQAICTAHNKGAGSYEQACAMAGLDPVTLEAVDQSS